ncbi:hypothetical protein BDW59DRAFT_161812 [Aspergillus cavernicola]|uniref:AA1-like domain-containing protein n=1 Tax=Aspergillus cavernicola TaxID=176166 RepID=A0ABR4IC65_9EURO
MRISILIPALALFVTNAAAIEMDVREDGQDWVTVTGIESGVCKTFDIDVIQVNIDPGSNDSKSFICSFYGYTP